MTGSDHLGCQASAIINVDESSTKHTLLRPQCKAPSARNRRPWSCCLWPSCLWLGVSRESIARIAWDWVRTREEASHRSPTTGRSNVRRGVRRALHIEYARHTCGCCSCCCGRCCVCACVLWLAVWLSYVLTSSPPVLLGWPLLMSCFAQPRPRCNFCWSGAAASRRVRKHRVGRHRSRGRLGVKADYSRAKTNKRWCQAGWRQSEQPPGITTHVHTSRHAQIHKPGITPHGVPSHAL